MYDYLDLGKMFVVLVLNDHQSSSCVIFSYIPLLFIYIEFQCIISLLRYSKSCINLMTLNTILHIKHFEVIVNVNSHPKILSLIFIHLHAISNMDTWRDIVLFSHVLYSKHLSILIPKWCWLWENYLMNCKLPDFFMQAITIYQCYHTM